MAHLVTQAASNATEAMARVVNWFVMMKVLSDQWFDVSGRAGFINPVLSSFGALARWGVLHRWVEL